jgi:hypothetical protein
LGLAAVIWSIYFFLYGFVGRESAKVGLYASITLGRLMQSIYYFSIALLMRISECRSRYFTFQRASVCWFSRSQYLTRTRLGSLILHILRSRPFSLSGLDRTSQSR